MKRNQPTDRESLLMALKLANTAEPVRDKRPVKAHRDGQKIESDPEFSEPGDFTEFPSANAMPSSTPLPFSIPLTGPPAYPGNVTAGLRVNSQNPRYFQSQAVRQMISSPYGLGRSRRIFRDWGIPEWFVVSQALLVALMFIPGLSAIRFVTKMASFFSSLLIIWMVYRDGRLSRVKKGFRATAWLRILIVMLIFLVFHPYTLSLTAGTAQMVLYLSSYAVAFWGVASLRYGFQLQRVFVLLFLINSFSALLGIGQFYRPGLFLPPSMPVFEAGGLSAMLLQYELDDGTKVIRPCGLGDTPGQASFAGAMAAMMGIIVMTSSLPRWQRVSGLMLAIPGAAVIYLTQVRTAILMVVIALMALTLAFFFQRRWKSIIQMGLAGLIVVLGGFAWAAREGGSAVIDRFFTLLADNPANVLMTSSRAQMVNASLTEMIWDLPMGGGMGRFGQVFAYFGTSNIEDMIWCETQISAWIIDGGMPMLFLGLGAVIAALVDSLRVARKCPHPVIRHWAAGVFAVNFSLFFICFGQMPFLTNTGQQFWLLAAMTHAADRWVRFQIRQNAARLSASLT